MTTQELIDGKGRRVEIRVGSELLTGVLMSKTPGNSHTAFYVRIDGKPKRSIVSLRMVERFI